MIWKKIRNTELTPKKLVILLVLGILYIFGTIILIVANNSIIADSKAYINSGTIYEGNVSKYCFNYTQQNFKGGVRIEERIYVDFNKTFILQESLESSCNLKLV